jgi:flagellar motor switch/type III secretory pathway protein FliN
MTAQEEIAHIANVPIDLEVQLDQRWMKLSEILALEEGSIIEMRRSAGENWRLTEKW